MSWPAQGLCASWSDQGFCLAPDAQLYPYGWRCKADRKVYPAGYKGGG